MRRILLWIIGGLGVGVLGLIGWLYIKSKDTIKIFFEDL